MNPSLPAVIISGPTAAGKSALALRFAGQCASEIISADSAQVYIDMNIGTAKPDANIRARVPHHLIDLIPPTESYSAAKFVEDALAAVRAVRAKNRVPIIVGGTMFYIKALLEGLSALPPANFNIRDEINQLALKHGWAFLHQELYKVDPVTATRLHPTDAQRISRALEVFRGTGKPLSSLQGKRAPSPLGDSLHIVLMPKDRARLHALIEARFESMLNAGLVDEVRALQKKYPLSATHPSIRSVGYRQVWGYLADEYPYHEMREKGIAATRQLAKRQLTWLRHTDHDIELDPFEKAYQDISIENL
ncbi:MAG: tRNA (adenosine(37)-N6)-dimethylallyltransferase MiaA [Burkholderiales bacterium]|jgi:tRNA dimethylallyltransferase|nr:tRNA (adenosine(37)-N6)-dimethylallyltransferase MiaA [Burkholderiales bacterium]